MEKKRNYENNGMGDVLLVNGIDETGILTVQAYTYQSNELITENTIEITE